MESRGDATHVQADSCNVMAELIQSKVKGFILVACREGRATNTEFGRGWDLAATLLLLEAAVQKAQQDAGRKKLDLLICADFNRYYVLLGGCHRGKARQTGGESDAIYYFILKKVQRSFCLQKLTHGNTN